MNRRRVARSGRLSSAFSVFGFPAEVMLGVRWYLRFGVIVAGSGGVPRWTRRPGDQIAFTGRCNGSHRCGSTQRDGAPTRSVGAGSSTRPL